jgi:hypothetical protein
MLLTFKDASFVLNVLNYIFDILYAKYMLLAVQELCFLFKVLKCLLVHLPH